MLAVACTNSVIGKGIMTYCPPTAVPKLLSNPLTKEVRDLIDVENEGHGGVDDEHQVHINTYDGDDGLLDDPQTKDDTNEESSHDGLLDNPQTNSDSNDEGSHDGLLDGPQTNSDANNEGSHDGLLDNLKQTVTKMMKVVMINSLPTPIQTVTQMIKGCGRGAML
ncbi:hypothetical protein PoB_002047900 [Plakobranchus ocellatus]|uniref:Uncharacterized protein n=1 Tax=Plakobranchus ocellatus TaxID=259542 RepID=A0AAV3ZF64_9GAST|nr:hypothetical protein PoB_002047900 [Plakobranchus ocellatus]